MKKRPSSKFAFALAVGTFFGAIQCVMSKQSIRNMKTVCYPTTVRVDEAKLDPPLHVRIVPPKNVDTKGRKPEDIGGDYVKGTRVETNKPRVVIKGEIRGECRFTF